VICSSHLNSCPHTLVSLYEEWKKIGFFLGLLDFKKSGLKNSPSPGERAKKMAPFSFKMTLFRQEFLIQSPPFFQRFGLENLRSLKKNFPPLSERIFLLRNLE